MMGWVPADPCVHMLGGTTRGFDQCVLRSELALGRKNYLHAESHEAAQRAAIICLLLGTCELQAIDPQAPLEDALKRMPTHTTAIGELLPHRWTKRESAPMSQTQLSPVRASALAPLRRS